MTEQTPTDPAGYCGEPMPGTYSHRRFAPRCILASAHNGDHVAIPGRLTWPRGPVYADTEIERLRARVAQLEAAACEDVLNHLTFEDLQAAGYRDRITALEAELAELGVWAQTNINARSAAEAEVARMERERGGGWVHTKHFDRTIEKLRRAEACLMRVTATIDAAKRNAFGEQPYVLVGDLRRALLPLGTDNEETKP